MTPQPHCYPRQDQQPPTSPLGLCSTVSSFGFISQPITCSQISFFPTSQNPTPYPIPNHPSSSNDPPRFTAPAVQRPTPTSPSSYPRFPAPASRPLAATSSCSLPQSSAPSAARRPHHTAYTAKHKPPIRGVYPLPRSSKTQVISHPRQLGPSPPRLPRSIIRQEHRRHHNLRRAPWLPRPPTICRKQEPCLSPPHTRRHPSQPPRRNPLRPHQTAAPPPQVLHVLSDRCRPKEMQRSLHRMETNSRPLIPPRQVGERRNPQALRNPQISDN
jgi:hypothetical protein